MIVEFRNACRTLLEDQSDLPVYDYVPEDVAHLPCIVVGRPEVTENNRQAAVFDLDLDLWVIGNRNTAGDTALQLDEATDSIVALFGGTRSTSAAGVSLQVASVSARTVEIAATTYPCYTVNVETSTYTC